MSTEQSSTSIKSGEHHPLKIPQGLWQEISIDIIGPSPRSNRIDIIICYKTVITRKCGQTSRVRVRQCS